MCLRVPSLNLFEPSLIKFLQDSTVPSSTNYCPDFCFFWSKNSSAPCSRRPSISPKLPFNILLPVSLSQLFARYFTKKKFEKVIYAKGVHGRQWVNVLSFSVDMVILKEVSQKHYVFIQSNEIHVVEFQAKTWTESQEGMGSGPLLGHKSPLSRHTDFYQLHIGGVEPSLIDYPLTACIKVGQVL